MPTSQINSDVNCDDGIESLFKYQHTETSQVARRYEPGAITVSGPMVSS